MNENIMDISSSSDLVEMWEQQMPSLMRKYNVPGVALCIWKNQRTNILTCGYSDTHKLTKIDDSTLFQSGSISKSLTAWGVMKLVEEKRLELDVPIEAYLSKRFLPASPYELEPITIKSLLSHTSGLNISGYLGYTGEVKIGNIAESETFDNQRGLSLKYKPSHGFSYSGGGYTVLQLLIEEVTGVSFEEFMKIKVLHPLGMYDSEYRASELLETRLAQPYGLFGGKVKKYQFAEYAATGLYSSIRDLSVFLGNHFDNTESTSFLSVESHRLMRTRIFRTVNYGLGYNIVTFPQNKKMIYHHGETIGYSSSIAIFPDKQRAISLMCNSNNGRNLINHIFAEWLKNIVGSVPPPYLDKINLINKNRWLMYTKYLYYRNKRKRFIK